MKIDGGRAPPWRSTRKPRRPTPKAAASAAASRSSPSGVGKAVVLVQNNGNEGEYLAFELSFNATATNTTKDFTAAQLIGTVDFGNSVDFTNVLVA